MWNLFNNAILSVLVQLSWFDLAKLFICCHLYYLITTLCMFVTKMSSMQRGRDDERGRNRKRGHNNQSGQQEEDFQGWQNTNEMTYSAFLILTTSNTTVHPKYTSNFYVL